MFSTHVVASEVVDIGLGQHGVVLQLRLPQRRCIASDNNELSLAGSEGLEGGLVTESDCQRWLACVLDGRSFLVVAPLPDFITSARRELMLSAVFLAFFGAIVARYSVGLSSEGCCAPAKWVVVWKDRLSCCRTIFALSTRKSWQHDHVSDPARKV